MRSTTESIQPDPKPSGDFARRAPGVVVCAPGGRASLQSELDSCGLRPSIPVVTISREGDGLLALGGRRPERALLWTIGMAPSLRASIAQELRDLGWRVDAQPDLAGAIHALERYGSVPAGTAIAGSPDWSGLIDRAPHDLDAQLVGATLAGKRVLVTGAGGSIGSELARLVAGFNPSQLICMDRSENSLFEIDRQLARMRPGVDRRAVLHDIADEVSTRRIIKALAPDVVFHAAAHKHVPLMEDHPGHAAVNNVLGAYAVASASIDAGCTRFVFISTDKAVNPKSVMGATKRLAELCVSWLRNEALASGRAVSMPSVRFGNVLGSAGSVLPIWSAQLAEGGPLTVTDPRMTRYFMTIREAATLVLQAGAMDDPNGSASGATYVLDMGEPIRILDLAKRFIRQHGLRPCAAEGAVERSLRELAAVARGEPEAEAETELWRTPIDIVFTGSRPGEKLHEQLAYDAERLAPTSHPAIGAWIHEAEEMGQTIDWPAALEAIRASGRSGEPTPVLELLRSLLPTLSTGAGETLRRAG